MLCVDASASPTLLDIRGSLSVGANNYETPTTKTKQKNKTKPHSNCWCSFQYLFFIHTHDGVPIIVQLCTWLKSFDCSVRFFQNSSLTTRIAKYVRWLQQHSVSTALRWRVVQPVSRHVTSLSTHQRKKETGVRHAVMSRLISHTHNEWRVFTFSCIPGNTFCSLWFLLKNIKQ